MFEIIFMQFLVFEAKRVFNVIPLSSGFVSKGIIHFEKKNSPMNEFFSKILIEGNYILNKMIFFDFLDILFFSNMIQNHF